MTTPVPGPAASVLSAILVTDPNDPNSPLSVAIFSQSGQAPLLPSLANDVVAMPQDGLLDANGTWTGFLSTLGLTGATAPARWVGATTAGAPTTGTFSVGDFAVSGDGNVYVCTVAGSPGTWIASGSNVTGTASGDLSGTYPGPNVANTHYTTQSISAAATLGGTSAPVVLTDTTTAAFTLTLPGSPTAGRLFIVVDDTGKWNTHTLTVGRNGKQIDGAASNLSLTSQWGKVTLYYDGTAWWTLSSWPASSSGITPPAGDIGGTTGSPTVVSTHLSSALPRTQGGTGVTTTPAAPASFAPATPTTTTSTTLVMMGLGSTCTFTPASSGNVLVTVTFFGSTLTAAALLGVGFRFGTGTAPANGAAVTGTRFGTGSSDPTTREPAVSSQASVAVTAILALTPSTAYWFDIALSTGSAADAAQASNISMTFVELS